MRRLSSSSTMPTWNIRYGLLSSARFLHQGQICMSSNRIIVDASIYDEFVSIDFIAHVKTLKYGDPRAIPRCLIGPVINEKQLRGHLARIEGRTEARAHASCSAAYPIVKCCRRTSLPA